MNNRLRVVIDRKLPPHMLDTWSVFLGIEEKRGRAKKVNNNPDILVSLDPGRVRKAYRAETQPIVIVPTTYQPSEDLIAQLSAITAGNLLVTSHVGWVDEVRRFISCRRASLGDMVFRVDEVDAHNHANLAWLNLLQYERAEEGRTVLARRVRKLFIDSAREHLNKVVASGGAYSMQVILPQRRLVYGSARGECATSFGNLFTIKPVRPEGLHAALTVAKYLYGAAKRRAGGLCNPPEVFHPLDISDEVWLLMQHLDAAELSRVLKVAGKLYRRSKGRLREKYSGIIETLIERQFAGIVEWSTTEKGLETSDMELRNMYLSKLNETLDIFGSFGFKVDRDYKSLFEKCVEILFGDLSFPKGSKVGCCDAGLSNSLWAIDGWSRERTDMRIVKDLEDIVKHEVNSEEVANRVSMIDQRARQAYFWEDLSRAAIRPEIPEFSKVVLEHALRSSYEIVQINGIRQVVPLESQLYLFCGARSFRKAAGRLVRARNAVREHSLGRYGELQHKRDLNGRLAEYNADARFCLSSGICYFNAYTTFQLNPRQKKVDLRELCGNEFCVIYDKLQPDADGHNLGLMVDFLDKCGVDKKKAYAALVISRYIKGVQAEFKSKFKGVFYE